MKMSLAVTVALACVTGPEVENHCRGCCGIGKPAQVREDQSPLWRTQASSFEELLGPDTMQDNTCPHEPGAPETQHTYLIFWFASEMSSINS